MPYCRYLGVADDNDAKSCPSQSDIQTPWVVKKSDTLVLVRPHTRQHNEIFFSALERIDACHFNLLQHTHTYTTHFTYQQHINVHQLRVCRVNGHSPHLTGHFGDGSLQPIDCTGTDKQTKTK